MLGRASSPTSAKRRTAMCGRCTLCSTTISTRRLVCDLVRSEPSRRTSNVASASGTCFRLLPAPLSALRPQRDDQPLAGPQAHRVVEAVVVGDQPPPRGVTVLRVGDAVYRFVG